MNDQHARNREAMARRLHFYLESSLVSGSVTHSPEWLAATIRRMCDPEWPTEATRIFFRAVEKGAGERHEASPETWLRVAELLEQGSPPNAEQWEATMRVLEDRSGTQGQACHPQCACGADPMVGTDVCWRCDTQGQASGVSDYYATPDGPVNATLDERDYALLREWLDSQDQDG